jgi:uncharacterized membrane-anchored protein YitT (DUF2179 family)
MAYSQNIQPAFFFVDGLITAVAKVVTFVPNALSSIFEANFRAQKVRKMFDMSEKQLNEIYGIKHEEILSYVFKD